MASDAFGKPYEGAVARIVGGSTIPPLMPSDVGISPLSHAQETSLTDMVTILVECNAKMGETIVAQADQLVSLNIELRELRKS